MICRILLMYVNVGNAIGASRADGLKGIIDHGEELLNLHVQLYKEFLGFWSREHAEGDYLSVGVALDAVDEFHGNHAEGTEDFLDFRITLSFLFQESQLLTPFLLV